MIGLFFGDTDFPKIVLNKIKKLKINFFIIDLSQKKIFKNNKNSYSISVGQIGRIINLINEKKCKKVLFAGKINKPKFSSLKLDFKGLYYMPRIIKASKLGDAAILKEIINILAKERIRVVSSIAYNPELALSTGDLTKLKPTVDDISSIKKGIQSLNNLNAHNHVQGLVVRNSIVIAKETSKGTKKMLQLVKGKNNLKGVLIKFPKKKQDLRIDLPTIGLDTLKDCKSFGIKGIVLKSKQNIFLDKAKCVNFANKNNIFITIK